MSSCQKCYTVNTGPSAYCEKCSSFIENGSTGYSPRFVDGRTFQGDKEHTTNVELQYLLSYIKNNEAEVRPMLVRYNASRIGVDVLMYQAKLILSLLFLLVVLYAFYKGEGVTTPFEPVVLCGTDDYNVVDFLVLFFLIGFTWLAKHVILRKIVALQRVSYLSVLSFIVIDYFLYFGMVFASVFGFLVLFSSESCESYLSVLDTILSYTPAVPLYTGSSVLLSNILGKSMVSESFFIMLSFTCTLYSIFYLFRRCFKRSTSSSAAVLFMILSVTLYYLIPEFTTEFLIVAVFASKVIDRALSIYFLNIKDHKEKDRQAKRELELYEEEERIRDLELSQQN